MTLGSDETKIYDFQQRRRLRLQQVREQSKDIAKKIRQRAKVENLRHELNIGSKKEKEYFECQEKLIRRLEELYSEGVKNIGLAHKDIFENYEGYLIKDDPSKLRGKEAVAILRRQKQEKLNEHKRLLDRKLKAREAANEISREKSSTLVKALENFNKNSAGKSSKTECDKEFIKQIASNNDKVDVKKTDMGTQWDTEVFPISLETTVPTIPLPNEDVGKDADCNNAENTNRSKKPNLFALSDEMTMSLNDGKTTNRDQQPVVKSSSTLISEYLQNRTLRLREFESTTNKKSDDLQSIKQTILRTRGTKTDGSVFKNVCHVLDEQVIPVPSWRAEGDVKISHHIKQYNNMCYCLRNSFATVTTTKACGSLQLNSSYLKAPVKCSKRNQYFASNRTELCYGTCVKAGDHTCGLLTEAGQYLGI